jgi:Domain of unknown function (DUF4145)
MTIFTWDAKTLTTVRYRCGYCDDSVASQRGMLGTIKEPLQTVREAYVAICPGCQRPSFLTRGAQVPGARYGRQVEGIPEKSLVDLYEEARDCMSISAYTAVVLSCRKILMHIAVGRGAAEGQSFVEYVTFLDEKHYIPPDGREWVDEIRKVGNQANHEIVIATKDAAEEVLSFVEMLLRFIYEFPAKVRRELQE